jgi:hypothetical protein
LPDVIRPNIENVGVDSGKHPGPAARIKTCAIGALEHDPEKWIPVFRKDHAPPNVQRAMTIQPKAIAL